MLERIHAQQRLFAALEQIRAPLARDAFKARCPPDLYIQDFLPPPTFEDVHFTSGWFREDIEDLLGIAQWYKDHGATRIRLFAG